MKEREFEYWKKVRAKGKYRYYFINGLISYGLPMFIVMTFFVSNQPLSVLDVIINICVWSAAGLIFGIFMWSVNERRFKKQDNNKDQGGNGVIH